MAKGFGKPPSNSLRGYLLVVVPKDNLYASRDPLDQENK